MYYTCSKNVKKCYIPRSNAGVVPDCFSAGGFGGGGGIVSVIERSTVPVTRM